MQTTRRDASAASLSGGRDDVEIAFTVLICPIISQGSVFRANTRGTALIPRIVSGYNGGFSLKRALPLSSFVPLCTVIPRTRARPRRRGGRVIAVCPKHFSVRTYPFFVALFQPFLTRREDAEPGGLAGHQHHGAASGESYRNRPGV